MWEVRFKDAPNVPRLGDVRRVPDYAYPHWGLPKGNYIEESDDAYRSEWESGSPRQMAVVVEAVTESGLGNFSQMLRDVNSNSVAALVGSSNKRLNYLEVGAGVSTVNTYQELQRRGYDLEKIHTIMVEPSKERVEDAASKIEGMGLKRDRDFVVIVGRDIDIPNYVESGSQDIVSSVASIHHHSYLSRPLGRISRALRMGGLLLIADWHNSLWDHPARVYQALKEDYEWSSKEKDLAAFLSAYPMALMHIPEPENPVEKEANRMIRRFWQSYGRIRAREIGKGTFEERDDIFMLEGHRLVERQAEAMIDAGFAFGTKRLHELTWDFGLNGNPHQILPGSSLIMFTIGERYL